MNIEEIKFNLSEQALANEISNNRITDCLYCSNWQHGGNMSYVMYKCKHCGGRRVRSNIKSIIQKFATQKGITYDRAYDLAYDYHVTLTEGPNVYFDEDYFESDLTKFFKHAKV